MRLFLGIFPPQEELIKIRNYIRELKEIKRNFKFVEYEQIHLTLKFLGNSVSQESKDMVLQNLKNHLNDIEFSNILVETANVNFGYKAQKKPQAIFIDVLGCKGLDQLNNQLSDIIKFTGLEDTIRRKERKKLTHHITIAKSKRSISQSLVRSTRAELAAVEYPKIHFDTNEIYLVESKLTEKGTVYKKLDKIEIINFA